MNLIFVPKSSSNNKTIIYPSKFGNISTVYIDDGEPLLLKGVLDNLEGDVEIVRLGLPHDIFTKEECENCSTSLLVPSRALDINWDGFICPSCNHINKF